MSRARFIIFLTTFILAMLVSCSTKGTTSQVTQYPATMIVTETDTATDTVVCEDYNGNLWEFEGIEDWTEGDIVAAIMYDNATEIIYDDEFVMVRYNGNVN